MGLVGYGSMGDEGFMKPYSDETNWEIDQEVRDIVKDQYKKTTELLEQHRDKVEALGEALLNKETLNLQDIIDVLGDRPYGMNETMQEYLEELNQRKNKEEEEKNEEGEEKKEEEKKEEEKKEEVSEEEVEKEEKEEQKGDK